VGKAISCLLERIAHLEKRLGVSPEGEATPPTNDCATCSDICEPTHQASRPKRITHCTSPTGKP
jgi:hypothetical protein